MQLSFYPFMQALILKCIFSKLFPLHLLLYKDKRSAYSSRYLDLLQVDLTSFLASGASLLGREAAKRATKSREVDLRPAPY